MCIGYFLKEALKRIYKAVSKKKDFTINHFKKLNNEV